MTWEQTAAILQKEGMALQKRVDQLEVGIQEAIKESYKDIGEEGKTLEEIFEDLEALVSPAPEGGGALDEAMSANRKMKAAAKALFASGRITRDELHSIIYHDDEGGGAANGGESQALQAAILGLHTLAGEFPTPTWKTREDYLQATISEINETLGKQ